MARHSVAVVPLRYRPAQPTRRPRPAARRASASASTASSVATPVMPPTTAPPVPPCRRSSAARRRAPPASRVRAIRPPSGANVTFTATVTGTRRPAASPSRPMARHSAAAARLLCRPVPPTPRPRPAARRASCRGRTVSSRLIAVTLATTAPPVPPCRRSSKTASTTGLASSANPSGVGASVTFTATVTGSAPTGSVAFRADGTTLSGCGAVALPTGTANSKTATCSTASLSAGDAQHRRDLWRRRWQQRLDVAPPWRRASTTASSSRPRRARPIRRVVGTSVTFTATVTGRAPTGSVAFTAGGTALCGCGAVPSPTGAANTKTATCSSASLSAGTHSIVATYTGDAPTMALPAPRSRRSSTRRSTTLASRSRCCRALAINTI